ncbi:hypothetical protein C8R45DRAFT_935936 [Mycena sanguinolenta]|nr:hypothetical protein C8R45DRAFT_935936 [Mycena sanguinolenta]
MTVATDSKKNARNSKKHEHFFARLGACRLPALDASVNTLGCTKVFCIPSHIVAHSRVNLRINLTDNLEICVICCGKLFGKGCTSWDVMEVGESGAECTQAKAGADMLCLVVNLEKADGEHNCVCSDSAVLLKLEICADKRRVSPWLQNKSEAGKGFMDDRVHVPWPAFVEYLVECCLLAGVAMEVALLTWRKCPQCFLVVTIDVVPVVCGVAIRGLWHCNVVLSMTQKVFPLYETECWTATSNIIGVAVRVVAANFDTYILPEVQRRQLLARVHDIPQKSRGSQGEVRVTGKDEWRARQQQVAAVTLVTHGDDSRKVRRGREVMPEDL